MHSYVIFNPNQEKNLLGYKEVDNSNYLNSVPSGWCGDKPAHCSCSGCIDYRVQGEFKKIYVHC